ncbi:hypothetical protein Droror1_Dr00027530 [Drosera rotundifolia]
MAAAAAAATTTTKSPTSSLRFPSLAVLPILSLLLFHHLSFSLASASQSPHFEGFDDSLDEVDEEDPPIQLTDLIVPSPSPPLSDSTPEEESQQEGIRSKPGSKPPSRFEYWDEDEFEGFPTDLDDLPSQSEKITDSAPESVEVGPQSEVKPVVVVAAASWRSYTIEVICVSFLVVFLINYFTGKRENENLALAWAAKFATKDTIFEKNFSLLGVGEGEDSPLLLKEGQNVFKFYASGRRFCQGVLATMELKSRHDLLARVYNMVVPCKDEICFEVYMNDDAMDHVVFAVVKKKAAKGMLKEVPDLQRFTSLMNPPSGRKWVSEDLSIISESKEVAGDLITESVLDQVFGERAFEKFGKAFISMHFSDQHVGTYKKKLVFKFAVPSADSMADMTRLVALVPYYIDLVGRCKLSSQARSKTDAARVKAAQEAYKELQNARQEALQKKKAEKKKMMEEAAAKLSAEAIQKREAKERARQMKKAMPKIKMSRA